MLQLFRDYPQISKSMCGLLCLVAIVLLFTKISTKIKQVSNENKPCFIIRFYWCVIYPINVCVFADSFLYFDR